jgi:hypothetical protein
MGLFFALNEEETLLVLVYLNKQKKESLGDFISMFYWGSLDLLFVGARGMHNM